MGTQRGGGGVLVVIEDQPTILQQVPGSLVAHRPRHGPKCPPGTPKRGMLAANDFLSADLVFRRENRSAPSDDTPKREYRRPGQIPTDERRRPVLVEIPVCPRGVVAPVTSAPVREALRHMPK